jgi:acetylornithine deacetylase
MTPPKGDAVALLRELVRVDSRNPSLAPGAPAEGPIAHVLVDAFRAWGVDAKVQDALPGRPNVVATIKGTGGGKSLMFNGHIDVVDVAGMVHPPFDANEKDGRLYGRGSSDMKGGVAAMCAAAARLKGRLKGDLIVACVADEEWESAGTTSLMRSGLRADAAIVTEPTGLQLMPAHKGFVWMEFTIEGRAAHGSRWDLGIDAIRNAGLVLAEFDRIDREELPKKTHPLLGRPSLHVGTIRGGSGLSTYPERCDFTIERRTLPGENTGGIVNELNSGIWAVGLGKPELKFGFTMRSTFEQPPSDVALDAPVVVALSKTLREHGLSDKPAGMSAWTDAALLNKAGIPAICFGPGDMGLAHAAEEYIEVREVAQATDILESFALAWCN